MVYINLISSPRNISTALMYSFAQRSDTVVLDEPFYAFYLLTSGANHPGRNEVLRSQSNSEEAVKKEIFSIRDKEVVFIKNMSHHLEVMDESFVNDVVNVFFIRDPRQIIASYAQVIDKPIMREHVKKPVHALKLPDDRDVGPNKRSHLYKREVLPILHRRLEQNYQKLTPSLRFWATRHH